jgi:hypothetical protein
MPIQSSLKYQSRILRQLVVLVNDKSPTAESGLNVISRHNQAAGQWTKSGDYLIIIKDYCLMEEGGWNDGLV